MRTRLRLIVPSLLFVAAALVLCVGYASQRDQEPSTPAQILHETGLTYAQCKSYSDSGAVRTISKGETIEEKRFATAFVRPDRFRFEFTNRFLGTKTPTENRFIIWRQGNQVRTCWDLRPGIVEESSLMIAVAKATGISGGTAHYIPGLLMPDEIRLSILTVLREPQRLDDAVENGVDCFQLQGRRLISLPDIKLPEEFDGFKLPRQSTSVDTVWIEKKTFLVRKIQTRLASENFDSQMTITYEPVLDGTIPGKLLEFNPPGK